MCGDHASVTALIDYDAFCSAGQLADVEDDVEIEPRALAKALKSAEPPAVLDVREVWEYDIAHIAGSQLIPLSQLPARLAEVLAAPAARDRLPSRGALTERTGIPASGGILGRSIGGGWRGCLG